MSSLFYWVLGTSHVHRTGDIQAGAASEPAQTSVCAHEDPGTSDSKVSEIPVVKVGLLLVLSCDEMLDTVHLWREGVNFRFTV